MIQSKHGAPPGSLIYLGPERKAQPKITLIEYNEKDIIQKEFSGINDCLNATKDGYIKWINVEGVHHTEIIERIGDYHNLHALTLEDIVHVNQRPKCEDYDDYLFCIVKMITYNDDVQSEQLSLILKGDTIISFQEPTGIDAFDIIRNRLNQSKGRIRKLGADYLFYALMDAVVDWYFIVIERVGDDLELIEEEIISDPQKHSIQELYELKRQIIHIRRQVWPLRDMLNNLNRSENELITENTHLFFRDLNDHTIRIIDTVETYRDLLTGMMDVYISSNSNKMNEIMKVLTIMSSIFIPITFISGLYGMNFEKMPGLKTEYGFLITCLTMLLVVSGLLLFFRKRKWL
ncbi:MAG: magnesium/cobalt transporter CorA [Sphingobacteriaceae bacterium]|nr:magnesium/cobalt transporter CorA [Sphingobacteriaceae bacterium]